MILKMNSNYTELNDMTSESNSGPFKSLYNHSYSNRN